MNDRNCLSYWFPKLQVGGISVPMTEIVRTDVQLNKLLNGNMPDGYDDFLDNLKDAVITIGGFTDPVFLRTGHGSGKHDWKNCCYLRYIDDLPAHIAALVEWSEMVDILGLPTNVWAVRGFLPTKPVGVLKGYGDMPLVPEVRAFVRDGKVCCHHNYWPVGAILQGMGRDRSRSETERLAEAERLAHDLDVSGVELDAALALASKVATAFADDGAWSVDLLPTEDGWYVTDMAEAHRSYHVPGCLVEFKEATT